MSYALNWLQNASYGYSLRAYADWNEVLCAETDTALDDHLGDVTIPVFLVASAGGTGERGIPTLARLGSKDVSHYVARLHPVGDEKWDLGHLELWLSDKAEDVAWRPIWEWLKKH